MYKEQLGEKLKKARQNAGYTQTQVTNLIHITQSQLSKIENGQIEPNIELLGNLIDFYKISADWILTGKTAVSENANFLDAEETELINSFRELPEDEKEELLYLLRLKVQKVKKDITAKSSHSIDTETNNMIS